VFTELKKDKAERILRRRTLGSSVLRLLPKSAGFRPIANLRRRPLKKTQLGRTELGSSVNSQIMPVFSVLNYEKLRQPDKLRSAMFSVGDMYSKLKDFKENVFRPGMACVKPFYFVKLDIQSCFDTIPQHQVLRAIERLVSEDEYLISKHVELRPSDPCRPANSKKVTAGLVKKFVTKATGFTDFTSLYDIVVGGGGLGKKHTVFVETAMQKQHDTEELLYLLEEHVKNNIFKIGKKYFRQRNGIPQGSILSTLLCNFFYAEHERDVLGFLHVADTVLLRLVDDFLLITTEKHLALQFLQVMLDGSPEYGINVNAAKSLVNFEATINGCKIPRLIGTLQFPYCGNLIDTRTLAITRDRTRRDPNMTISDLLTVSTNRAPGQSFYRKALLSFNRQAHSMFLDTEHNPTSVVLAGIYHNFVESAMKMYHYAQSLSRRGRHSMPPTALLTRTLGALIDLALRFCKSSAPENQFECAVTNLQVRWLAVAAFRFVLGRKQTKFAATLRWLDEMHRTLRPLTDGESVKLWKIVEDGKLVFESHWF
jgi:telomerase reverse transcriptase